MKKIAALLFLQCAALGIIGMAYNTAVPETHIKQVPLQYQSAVMQAQMTASK